MWYLRKRIYIGLSKAIYKSRAINTSSSPSLANARHVAARGHSGMLHCEINQLLPSRFCTGDPNISSDQMVEAVHGELPVDQSKMLGATSSRDSLLYPPSSHLPLLCFFAGAHGTVHGQQSSAAAQYLQCQAPPRWGAVVVSDGCCG